MMTLQFFRSTLPWLGPLNRRRRAAVAPLEGTAQGRVDLVGAGPG